MTEETCTPRVQIRPANVNDAIFLAPRLRRADKWEVMCSSGLNAEDALTQSVQFSEVCWTAHIDGNPEIMWGACKFPPDDSMGIVWLMSSEEMYRIPNRFWKESVRYVAKMNEHFDTLFNYVHHENMASRKWLTKLGFEEKARVEEYGVGKQPFILYSRTV